jgi:16S rRNA (adenine1518-N6/adenine1519-N6)-dimethyltransferase
MNPYLDSARVRAALRSLELRPSKGMGQNFLTDAAVLQTIVSAAGIDQQQTVIEVGPGLGVLTWELLQRAGRVISVELDRRLAERLRHEFADRRSFTLVESDVLRITPPEILAAADATAPYLLVANIPYAITAPILRHFLEAAAPPERSVLLVQWEVAERVCAGAGDLSVLAHAVQFYSTPSIVARVPAAAFWPAPAVDSAVLRLDRRTPPQVTNHDQRGLFRLIRAGHLHARKQLGNALPSGLKAQGLDLPREQVQAALTAVGIDARRRAETVTLTEWIALHAQLLHEESTGSAV